MHKWMAKSYQQEAQVTEEGRAKIANLKEGFYIEIVDMREDSYTRIHWLWDELTSDRKENRWLWNFCSHTINYMVKEPPVKN